MHSSVASALAVLALTATPAVAHSWIEQMMVINADGTFTGQPGYCRNNTLRTAPGFTDLDMVHILPGQGQPSIEERQAPAPSAAPAKSDTTGVLPTDPMCKKTQQTQYQSNGSPRLQAQPGAMIALRYEENGHVTLPNNQPGKPANRGNVYIYGTSDPKPQEIFLDIFGQWNQDGTGGDKRGKLLAVQPFDDGQCYQINSGNISAARQAQYPHTATTLMGANLWCQNDIKLPADLPTGKPYTVYWVWDWPTLPHVDPNLPNGKAELYTTCMDIDITSAKASRDLEIREPASSGGNIDNMAVPSYLKQLAAAPVPAAQSSAPAAPAASNPPAQSSAPVVPAASAPAASPAVTVTVTVSAAPSTPAATQPAAQPNTIAAQPSSAAASQAVPLSMPPASLNLAAPALSANAAPAASTSPAKSLPTYTNTATALTPTSMLTYASSAKSAATPSVAARGCAAKNCKIQKRSRILAK